MGLSAGFPSTIFQIINNMKFYLTGGWGYGNKGDNAIFEATRQSLSDEFPGHELIVSSFSPQETLEQHGIKALPSVHTLMSKKAPLGLLRWAGVMMWKLTRLRLFLSPALKRHLVAMESADVVIMAGGGYFNDAWLDMLVTRYLEIDLAHYSGKPMVMLGQTIGPFGRSWMTGTLTKYLAKVTKIVPRDEQSLGVLKRASVPSSKVVLSADEVNLIKLSEPNVSQGEQIKMGLMFQLYRPHLAVDGPSPTGCITSEEQYIESVTQGLSLFMAEHPQIEYHFIPSTQWDEVVCKKVFDRIHDKGKCEFHSDPHVQDFINLCQGIDIMLSTNMHPIILATTAGKPSIALSYHYKLDDYMKSVSQSDKVLRIDDFKPEQMAQLMGDVFKSLSQIKISNDGPKKLARNNMRVLRDVLNEHSAMSS